MRKFIKKNKYILSFLAVSSLIYLIAVGLFITKIYALTGIETVFRIAFSIFLILCLVFHIFICLKKIKKSKYKLITVLNVVVIIFAVVIIILSNVIGTVYSSLSNIGESDNLNYTSKLIMLEEEELTSNSVIGMTSNEEDVEGYILANIIYSDENLDNEIVYYETYYMMLSDLYAGVIDAAFVQNNYVSLYESEELFENIYSETYTVYSYSEQRENNDKVESTNKTFDEPLTFLIMGVDSTIDGLDDSAAFNGDTLMLITFNPTTYNVTMFSIPRDLMVPISCNNNSVAKINSAAGYSTSCVIDTVENLTDIEIDYYVKINFTGVVDLVNALGGIEVDVEAPDYDTYGGQICEQDSNREFGDSLICIDSGYQTLNGEEALAYARNRKLYTYSDIDRIAHQQQVVTAIAQKASEITSYSAFESILTAVEDNIVTNMTTDQILSSYDVLKDMLSNVLTGDDFINIEKSYLEYYDLRVYLSSYGYETAGLGYYKDSLNDIIEMMKINLELETEEIVTTFSYENGEVYEQTVAGENYSSQTSYSVLTDFTGKTVSSAQSYCNSNSISCTFVTVDSDSDYYNSSVETGLVASQSIHQNTLLNLVSSITLYVNGEVISNEPSLDSSDEEIVDSTIDSEDDENVDEQITDDEDEILDDSDENLIIQDMIE